MQVAHYATPLELVIYTMYITNVVREGDKPVNSSDGSILTERRLMLISLLPDLLALLHIVW